MVRDCHEDQPITQKREPPLASPQSIPTVDEVRDLQRVQHESDEDICRRATKGSPVYRGL